MKVIDDYDIVCFQEFFQSASFRPERIIQEAIKKSKKMGLFRIFLLEDERAAFFFAWSGGWFWFACIVQISYSLFAFWEL